MTSLSSPNPTLQPPEMNKRQRLSIMLRHGETIRGCATSLGIQTSLNMSVETLREPVDRNRERVADRMRPSINA
jgi:hypothetical protein